MTQQLADNFIPSATGYDLGSPTQLWDIYAQNINVTNFGEFRHADAFTGGTDELKVQAAVNDLPNATHDGVVIVPPSMNPDMSQVTLGTNTLVINYSTLQNTKFPTYWSGGGNAEFIINAASGQNAPYFIMNNVGTGTVERGTGLVFRTGGTTTGIAGPLRNIWQLKSGNFGNAVTGVNADDLVLTGYQVSKYTTGTATVTNLSDQVVGVATGWTTPNYDLAGGNFGIDSQPLVGATVLSVEDDTHLTLAEPWTGTTSGATENYTVLGGSNTGNVSKSRLILGQNGVWLFNPTGTDFDPLVEAAAGRIATFSAPDSSNWPSLLIRLNNFQGAGNVGFELRANNSDAKRKFVVLNHAANDLEVLAADGTTALATISDAGNLRVTGKIGIGKAPLQMLDIKASADNVNPILVYRSNGTSITHNAAIDNNGFPSFLVYDNNNTAQVTLNGNTTAPGSYSLFKLGVDAKRYKATQGTALVAGDFALSAGWGNSASVGSVRGYDQWHEFVVTSAGAGQGASPTITLTYKDLTWTTAPIVMVRRQEYANQATVTFTVTTQGTTSYVLTFNGTPVAAETYKLAVFVGGI